MKVLRFYLGLFMLLFGLQNFQSRANEMTSSAFALDFYQKLAAYSSDNFIFSPYSFYEAFAVCAEGAKGKTRDEFNQVFHFEQKEGKRFHYDFSKEKNVIFHSANGIWVDAAFSLLPEFENKVREKGLAEVKSVDFQHKTETSRKEINQWIEQQTQNKIRDLLPPESVKPITKVIIANALYFLGKWENPFEVRAFKEPFYGEKGEKSEVFYLTDKRVLSYAEKEGIKAVQLDYLGKRFSMLVLLSEKSQQNLSILEKKVTVPWLEDFLQQLKATEVSFRMPRFKQEFTLIANDVLKKMGLTTSFDENLANFSGLARKPLYISEVIHKAFIEVSEQGTEAAATTAITMEIATARYDPTPIQFFHADHPFLFAIRDNKTGAILFMGRCMKP